MPSRSPLLASLFALAGLTACGNSSSPPDFLQIAGAEPERGRHLIYSYGCGTCHAIEGVPGARGMVGPKLDDFAQRTMLAGILPNVPRHLVPWLVDPPAIEPKTGMPKMGVTDAEARDMAAYLYTLGAADVRVAPADLPVDLRPAD
ncbi:c-type cytochrome [Microvirga pudoricolor]|uniref:c-type cytochrome n=1 Tax=Microvirga pudoricolor TaxID=2778729 RepID=UPI00194F0A37|nr:cytochrome c [Microvirga pudoricolor]MBM6594945.1 c-type cytochrome [Microvirga pudoricolor]